MKRIIKIFLLILFLSSCKNSKKMKNENISEPEKSNSHTELKTKKNENSTSIESHAIDIEGVYTFSSTISKCNLILEITKKTEFYQYKLKTPTRSLTGNITLEKINEENDAYYITFNGVEWSENNGPLDENGQIINENIILPKGLEGSISKDEITIQNYGNAMNSYLQLGECDTKYIHLKKVTRPEI